MVNQRPDFDLKENFPIASVIDAAQRNNALQQQALQYGQQTFVQGMEAIGQVGKSIVDRRLRMAQAMAAANLIAETEEGKTLLGENAVATVGGRPITKNQTAQGTDPQGHILNTPIPNKSPITRETLATAIEGVGPKDVLGSLFGTVNDVIVQKDAMGNIVGQSTVPRRKGGKTLIAGPSSAGAGFQQSQWVDSDGTPLNYNKVTGQYTRPDGSAAIKPVLKKGDESAIADAALLVNQIPNIKLMFDAYRNAKLPRLQSTFAGKLMDPKGKQAEDSLKLAAFTFGGKNLTGNEKQVVFNALFPSWTDNDESRDMKEKLLQDFAVGKIDLLEAANLLGPAGAEMRSVLEKVQKDRPKQETPTQNATTSENVLTVGGKFNGQKIVGVRKKT